MSDVIGNPSKIQQESVGFNKPHSAQLNQQYAENINYLIDNLGLSNSQSFTANGNFNVPENVTRVLIIAWGGGGGGGGNGTGSVDGGDGGQGGQTVWADPTNGTVNFKGGAGGGRPGATTSVVPVAQPIAIAGHGGFSNGGSFGGHGADGLTITSGNGGDYLNYTGGAGGAWGGGGNRAGGGGGAGPGGNGAAGAPSGSAAPGSSGGANSGAGGGGASSLSGHGAGGGAGSPQYVKLLPVTSLDVIPVTIGAGGAGGFPTAGSGAVAGGAGGSGYLEVWW